MLGNSFFLPPDRSSHYNACITQHELVYSQDMPLCKNPCDSHVTSKKLSA